MFARTLAVALLLSLNSAEAASPEAAAEITVDVVVVGATPGGVAAAVAAGRLNERVALLEYEDHVGGIVSNGLTNADIHDQRAVGGLFYEFTRRILKHYQAQDGTPGADGPNVKLCRNGYWYEASAAERVFRQMLADAGPGIELHLQQQLRQAAVKDGKLASVVTEDRRQPGRLTRWHAPVFIDATYEGDLAAMAGAAYRVGREARSEYDEPHAGKVYVRFGERELLPGSTGEADQAIQGFCFRFHVTQDPRNRVAVSQPEDYRREDYQAVLADIGSGRVTQLRQVIQFYPMPNGKFELNSDHPHPDTGVPSESFDLAEENWGWPEATPDQRQGIYRRYLSHNVGLLWFLQNDPEVPEAIRREASQFGWCRDEWPDNAHLPRQVYVRQGRRILGEYVLTQRDGDLDAALQRTRLQTTSIAIVEFAFDSHGTRKFDPAHPGVREGYIYIAHPPLQVPYGVLVPRQIDGLLVPVACSASHVGYNAVRMEPVFMALGEAAGTAAHVAIRRQSSVRGVPVAEVQHRLAARGAVLTHYDDLPFDHPAFAAFQWLGTRGLNLGYRAQPDLKLTRRDGWERLSRILQAEQQPWTPPSDAPDAPLLGKDVVRWLGEAGLSAEGAGVETLRDGELRLAQFATLVYHAFCAGQISEP